MTSTLKTLMTATNKAQKILGKGSSEIDARTVYGEEGKNYVAWSAAADAERAYREAHDLIGVRAR